MPTSDGAEGLRARLRELVALPKPYSGVASIDFRVRLENAWAKLAARVARAKAKELPADDLNRQLPWRTADEAMAAEAKALSELREEAGDTDALAEVADELERQKTFLRRFKAISRGSEGWYFGRDGDLDIAVATEDELREDIPRIESWIGECRARLDATWGPWLSLRYATAKEYDKHFPEPGWDTKQTRAMSAVRNADGEFVSYFYPGITRERLMEHFWCFLEAYWDEISTQHHVRMHDKALGVIGACRGEDASIILWDIHVSNKVVHGFPVRRADVPKDAKEYGCNDDLVGFSSYYTDTR